MQFPPWAMSNPVSPQHPFIADTLAETVLNIGSLLAVAELNFEIHPDDPRPTDAAYLNGQLLIVQAARQIVRYAWEACPEEPTNVTKLESAHEE